MIERGNISIRGDVGPVDVTAHGWNADRYEQAVASILDRLRATRVGAVVLRHLRQPVHIYPLEHQFELPEAWTYCFTRHGSPALSAHWLDRAPGSEWVWIEFTPAVYDVPDHPMRVPPGTFRFRADSVLLHELVHAVEKIHGVDREELVGSNAADIAATAEHRAIRVTNMYRAEQGQPFRGPYSDVTPLRSATAPAPHGKDPTWAYRGVSRERTDATSARHREIAAFESRLIERFFLDHPSFCGDLQRIPRGAAWYNPFQDFWTDSYPYVLVPVPWRPRMREGVPARMGLAR